MTKQRIVLLDTNTIIGAYDAHEVLENAADDPQAEAHRVARDKVQLLLDDPDVALATSALIRYEVLRGVKNRSFEDMERILDRFMQFEIRERDAKRAAEIFKLARDRNQPIDKRIFDVFHCVCAELNELDFESLDGDVPKIQKLIQSGNHNA